MSSARVIAIPLVSNSHQIFYDMTISQRRSRGCLRLIVIKPSNKSRINFDAWDISAQAGHDIYFYFIASVILPLSNIWKLKSYLSCINCSNVALLVQKLILAQRSRMNYT